MNNRQFYSNNCFERVVHIRNTNVSSPSSLSKQIIPVWHDQFFFKQTETGVIPITHVPSTLINKLTPMHLLGIENDQEISCIDLSSLDLSYLADHFNHSMISDLRKVVHQIPHEQSALLAYAKGIIRWSNTHTYCGACGSKTKLEQRGHSRVCNNPSCNTTIFPRIDPAVIVLVEYKPENGPAECLLQRRPTDFGYICSTLAGFVEIGESLEDAVKREMKEEVSIDVKNIAYMASQPWPFPASIMIGFKAEVDTKTFEVDQVEIKDARWYTASEIKHLVEKQTLQLSKSDSIARYLIEAWVENNS